MITVVEGRPGMGKSVFLTSEILRWMSKGHHVYTNIMLSIPNTKMKWIEHYHYIENLEECTELKNGKIILDEVQTYLNSRLWDKLDIRFQLLLQQHRKKGLDIIGATQSVKRADVVFRELIQVFYRIYKIISFKIPYSKKAIGFFLLWEYDPDSVEGANNRNYEKIGILPRVIIADPYTLSIFDTTQLYEPPIRKGQRYIEEWVYAEKPELVKQLVSKKKLEVE